jgi:hypothetical protein
VYSDAALPAGIRGRVHFATASGAAHTAPVVTRTRASMIHLYLPLRADQTDRARPARRPPRLPCRPRRGIGGGVPGLRSRAAVAVAALLLASGCTIAEVATTEPAELLVVEAILRPDVAVQRVMLHSTLTGGSAASVAEEGATVRVRTPAGREMVFTQSPTSEPCLSEAPFVQVACYLSAGQDGFWVRPGAEYLLTVTTRDGRRAFGRTRVPGAFELVRPNVSRSRACRLPPSTPLPLEWRRSDGAWSYIADLELRGLREALAGRVPGAIPESLNLTALSISEADTTMLLPRDFGLFQRTQIDQPLLLALRDGLPAGVTAHLVLVAADRNYVNGVRGGAFNPSGQVRIPSVAGDATGVFGSLVAETLLIEVASSGALRPCLEN